MNDELKNLNITELLERADLSYLDKCEIVELYAQAQRAEFVSQCISSCIRSIKALFVSKKADLSVTSGAHHA